MSQEIMKALGFNHDVALPKMSLMAWLTELLTCCFIIQRTHADTDELMTL